MKFRRIVVVGSSNTDMIIKLDRIPRPGETILGGEFVMAAGGKGANQAVSAARAGGFVVQSRACAHFEDFPIFDPDSGTSRSGASNAAPQCQGWDVMAISPCVRRTIVIARVGAS